MFDVEQEFLLCDDFFLFFFVFFVFFVFFCGF